MQPTIDTRNLGKQLSQVFSEYAAYNGRSMRELLEKQMVQLAIGAKGSKGLFQEAVAERQRTITEIKALPQKLNWRIKRWRGSVKQEIARRQRFAGYYQASGWIPPEYLQFFTGKLTIKTNRGSLSARLNGANPSITLTNKSPRALEFGSRSGYIGRAMRNRIRDMDVYIRRKQREAAAEFSKDRPSFSRLRIE